MTTGPRRVLYVMDPLLAVSPDKDTTFALMLESQARGAENLVCGIHDLWVESARGFARATHVDVRRPTADDPSHARVLATVDVAFDDVDVIWMRKDPPADDLFLYACMMLDRADPARTLVLNNPASLRVAHEKLWGLFADDVTPRQIVTSRPDLLVAFVQRMGKGVLKPLHLMGGMGVMAFDAADKNLRSAADLLTLEGRRPAIAQEFLPAVREGDKRVILLDGVPVGAVLRVPRGDDVRSNLHVGGTAKQAIIDDADRAICARIGPALKELGLFFVGIDVIGGKLTEVNVTSPTGVQEINRLDARTGADRIEALTWDAVERKLASRR
jgi:glutathione synthase